MSFGFTVKRKDHTTIRGFTELLPEPKWEVYLPHQCDEWSITEEYSYVSHEEATEALESFIKEAQEALSALKAGEEYRCS